MRPGAYVDGREVAAWAQRHGISRFLAPLEVEVVEELPRTGSGKFKKDVMREWASGGGGGGGGENKGRPTMP